MSRQSDGIIFRRLLGLCRGRTGIVRKENLGERATDADETLAEMEIIGNGIAIHRRPYTAVGILGWEADKRGIRNRRKGLLLATARTRQSFEEVVEKANRHSAGRWPDRLGLS